MSLVLKKIQALSESGKDKIAIIADGLEISYQTLWNDVCVLSEEFQKSEKQVFAFQLPNSYEWLVLDLALVKSNKISIPIPLFFSHEQRNNLFSRAGVEVFINENSFRLQKTGFVKNKFPVGTNKITFTSGTTGNSKGVCLSQDGIEKTALSIIKELGEDFSEKHIAILPLPVLLENIAGFYATILCGKTYIVNGLEKLGFSLGIPNFETLYNAIHSSEANSCILVPEILKGLVFAAKSSEKKLDKMKYMALGGSKVSLELLEEADNMKLPVYQGYGLSECASVVSINTPKNNKAGTVGKFLHHINFEIENGELIINEPATLGYIGDVNIPKRHETGDLVSLDKDGFLSITGRKKNIIINSYGRNISPEWVESEILANNIIAQAVVFGDAMPSISALIVPASMSVSDEMIEEAILKTNKKLPEYAQIKHWTKVMPFSVIEGLLTGTGRPKRAEIYNKYKTTILKTYEQEGKLTGFFEKLIKETEKERNYLYSSPQIQDGLNGDISLETYVAYLKEAYHHVKHTVPLMMTAGSKLSADKEALRVALAEYIEEEIGHDEWILNDIANCGSDKEKVRNSKPLQATELMVSYAYDYISRINPVGFFGMVFVLEGTSTQLATHAAEKIQTKLGLKKNCFSYLYSHGSLDIEHMKFFENLMHKIESPDDQEAIVHMAKRMFVLFANVFRSIPHKNLEVSYVS